MNKRSSRMDISSAQLMRLIAAADLALGVELSMFKEDYLISQFGKFMTDFRLSPIEVLIRLEAAANTQQSDRTDGKSRAFKTQLLDYLFCGSDRFFRDPEAYECMKSELAALPRRFDSRTFELLSAGCGSGEETASIVLVAWSALLKSECSFTLRGIDVSNTRIERCEAGTFHISALKDIPLEHRGGILVDEKRNRFSLAPKLKSHVNFRHANMYDCSIADEFKDTFHFISMRYVLVFLKPQSRCRLLENVLRMLKSQGVLWLGVGEFLEKPTNCGLELVDASFYKKIE